MILKQLLKQRQYVSFYVLEFFTENKNCEKRKMGASVRGPVVEVFCTILFYSKDKQ